MWTTTLTWSACCHLRTIWRIKGLMSGSGKLDRQFIFSRLDCCNGVFTGPSKETTRRLQPTLSATARDLAKTERVNLIRPVPGSLHWPPEVFRAKTQLWSAATSWTFRSASCPQSQSWTWSGSVQFLCSTYLEQTLRELQVWWHSLPINPDCRNFF